MPTNIELDQTLNQLREALTEWHTDYNSLTDTTGETLNNKFLGALEKLKELKSPDSITPILSMFPSKSHPISDDFEWTMLHLIESFSQDEYLNALLSSFPSLFAQSPYWLSLLAGRIQNSPAYYAATTDKLKSMPTDTQKAWNGALEMFNAE